MLAYKKWIYCLLLLGFFNPQKSLGSIEGASQYFKGRMDFNAYERMINELVNAGFVFSAIPFAKEYLVLRGGATSSEFNRSMDLILDRAGVHNLSTLPDQFLQKYQSANSQFILGKKYFNRGDLRKSLSYLNNIPRTHKLYPFVAHMKGTLYSLASKQSLAGEHFDECVQISNSQISQLKDEEKINQLRVNRDYCIAGKARSLFAAKEYAKANLVYLDLPKDSPVWPEILFEEAWNSYYLKNYNRSLGKLVSYKAPIFNFIFNPEIEILNALSYMRLCLFNDAQSIVDNFYKDYAAPSKAVKDFILNKKRDYQSFYHLMIQFERKKASNHPLIHNMLASIQKEPAYKELKGSLINALKEKLRLQKIARSSFGKKLLLNLEDTLNGQRLLLGGYVRRRLIEKYEDIEATFKGMSYIKLEILSSLKQRLYDNKSLEGKRGNVDYVKKSQKQYFWNFQGEFWADELGDYVFALRSYCGDQ